VFFDLFNTDYIFSETQICAGGNIGEDSCVGDSGGPLWVNRESSLVLYGIVSWGVGCASDYPALYTRVSSYVEWIESIVGESFSDRFGEGWYYIVQGNSESPCEDDIDPTCSTRAAHKDELWNVRCCADSDSRNWLINSNSGCTVWTNSNIPDCYKTDYDTAVQLCNDVDARLCTKEELEPPYRCSAWGGCGFDKVMVWSMSEVTFASAESQYFIVKGASWSTCEDTAGCETRAVSSTEQWNVRCCADTNPGGWVKNSGCTVFTESDVPSCVSTDWDSAVGICELAGGRLCTREEIEMNCAANGGCRYNYYMVWSSTESSSMCTN